MGPWFLLAGVRTLDALRPTVVDSAVYKDVSAGGWLCLFVFTEEAYGDDANFAARMPTLHQTPHEDPATGSANTAFAAHLRSLGRRGAVVVEQGFEVDRPSRLYLEVGERIRVGGKVRPVLKGTLDY